MSQGGGGITMIIYLIVIFAVMYFVMIRPQKKQEKQLKAMINAVKVGDEILTIGGIHGKITKIKDDNITIVSSTQKSALEISRWAIKDVTKYVEDIKEEKKQESKKDEKPAEVSGDETAETK
ncbi:MAG: preprotein translocase subunit YajC [Clostridia bacterium]|nr:preprotein translocase subunit YajC [Clostridia bacterium]